MRRTDLEELFTMVGVGDTVRILAEPDEQAAYIFQTHEEQRVIAAQTITSEQTETTEDISTSR
jgi:hypothetical protein